MKEIKHIQYYTMIKFFCGLLFFFTLFFSCSKKPDNSIQDKIFEFSNTKWKSQSISHHISYINYKATEVPVNYYISKNIPKSISNKDKDYIYSAHRRERIIEFEFQHDNNDDLLKSDFTQKKYSEAVKYMAFAIKKDFSVVTTSGDTINCLGVTFERNFKLAPFKRLLLNFNDIPESDNIKLIYQDRLFGNGLFKFNFREIPIKI